MKTRKNPVAELVTLWVRSEMEGPQVIDAETEALGPLFVSAEDAGIGDTGVYRVVVRGPAPHRGIPLTLHCARVLYEHGCDVWLDEPKACACDEAGCDACVETGTGRPGMATPSLGMDYFYQAGGGA